MDSWFKVLQNF